MNDNSTLMAVAAPEIDFDVSVGPVKALHGVNNAPLRIPEGSRQDEFRAAGIPYVRTHDTAGMWGGAHYVDIPNVFPDFDADENDPASYDFAFTDAYLRPLVEAGCEPFYRLGVTIENYWRVKAYNIYPPKDFAKWARICEHVVRHYNEGWANGFSWGLTYWEIWNEPENPPMWQGTREQYFELYRVAATHLKACFPGIKVGGYGGCGFYAVDDPEKKADAFFAGFVTWFEDFVKFVQAPETKCPLDFYSWHLYVDGQWTIRRIAVHAAYVRRVLDEAGLAAAESIFNEWNVFSNWAHCGFDAIKEPPVAAGVAAAFALMQDGPVDKAMYYDALPSRAYCGLFYFPSCATTPTYEAFRAFNVLYRLGNAVKVSGCPDDIFACAAEGGGDKAVLLSNIGGKTVQLLPQLKSAAGAVFKLYRLDETHRGLDFCGEWREGDRLTLSGNAFALLSTRDLVAPTSPSSPVRALNGIESQRRS